MDTSVLALGLTVAGNVLFLGFIYGKMSTLLYALREELRSYVSRTDSTVIRYDSTLMDHGQRISRLEGQRTTVAN